MRKIALHLGPERVCCLTGMPGPNYLATELGPIRVFRRPSVFEASRPVRALALGMTMAQILMGRSTQIMQFATVNDATLIPRLVRYGAEVPYVIYAHGNEILAVAKSTWREPVNALQRASRVLANSKYTAALVEKLGVLSRRITVLHPGCDPEQFKPVASCEQTRSKILGTGDPSLVLLTVGNVVERKGHDMVIRALSRLVKTHPNIRYIIVGDGPYRTQLEQLAFDFGVRENVVFAGRVLEEELPLYYSLCDVFLMPSRFRTLYDDVEGFGIVFLEANACGKPVIGSRSGGIADAVVEGQSGLLVDPDSADDIAIAIERLVGNKSLREQMGVFGRQRVLHELNWRTVAEKVANILDSVVSEPVP